MIRTATTTTTRAVKATQNSQTDFNFYAPFLPSHTERDCVCALSLSLCVCVSNIHLAFRPHRPSPCLPPQSTLGILQLPSPAPPRSVDLILYFIICLPDSVVSIVVVVPLVIVVVVVALLL